MLGKSCDAERAGKTTYTCPSGGHDVLATDDLAAAVSASAPGETLCIHGLHHVTAPLVPKSKQTWIGVDVTAGIDGSVALTGWTSSAGVWTYSGALAAQMNQNGTLSTGVSACYLVRILWDYVNSLARSLAQRLPGLSSFGGRVGSRTTRSASSG